MPNLRAVPVAVSESTATVNFVVYLDAPSVNEVRVNYGIDQGTAVYSGSGIDFRTQSGTLTFAPGETSKTIAVQIVDNTTAENTEVFWLDLSSPVNATVMQRWTPGFIYDNDASAGTPVINVTSPVVDEGGRSANFFVWLSRPATLPVSVSYSTADETAVAGEDYREGAGLLSFAPGEMVKTVSIELIDDSLAETQEYFRLLLANASGATLAQPEARAEIGPSDGPTVSAPYITARTVAAGESDTSLQFVISLSAPSGNEVRVNYGLDQGTAVYSGSGIDFSSYSGTLVFAPGETTKTLPVLVIDNTTRREHRDLLARPEHARQWRGATTLDRRPCCSTTTAPAARRRSAPASRWSTKVRARPVSSCRCPSLRPAWSGSITPPPTTPPRPVPTTVR